MYQTCRPLPGNSTNDDRQRRFVPFILLILAAVLLTVCVYVWQKQARQKALSQAVDAVESAISGTEAMEAIQIGLAKSFEGARNYAGKILSVDPKKASARGSVRSLARQALQDDGDAFAAWFVFEPNAFDGKDSQYREKDGFEETGRMAGILFRASEEAKWNPLSDDFGEDGGVYRKIMESGKEGIYRIYTHVDVDMPRLFADMYYGGAISPFFPGSPSEYAKETPCAVLGVPLKRNGKTIGAAGLDISLDPLNEALYMFQLPCGIETFLVPDTGYVVATSAKWSLGNKLEELYLSGLADFIRADDSVPDGSSAQWNFGQDGSALYCRRFTVGGGSPWTMAFFVPPEILYGDILEITTATLIGGYAALLVIGGIVLLVRRVKTLQRNAAQNADVSVPGAPIDPVTAGRLKALNRQSGICRLLAVLFFMPSLFFMAGAEKQLKEATAVGNLQKAEQAVRKLWTAAVIGLCIGIPLLVLYIGTCDY